MFKRNKEKEKGEGIFYTKVFPAIAKLSTQKHLVTIRDAFGMLTPLIIAGAISLACAIFIFGNGGSKAQTSLLGLIAKAAGGVVVVTKEGATHWILQGAWLDISKIGSNIFSTITDATLALMSLFLSFQIAYVYARMNYEKVDAILAGMVGIASFAIISHGFGGGNAMFMGAQGILSALVISFIAGTIFNWLSGVSWLKIRMPKEVPPAVAKGFSFLFPILITFIFIGAIDTIAYTIVYYTQLDIKENTYKTDKTGQPIFVHGHLVFIDVIKLKHGTYGMAGLFYYAVSEPFNKFANSAGGGLGIGIMMNVFLCFFWFFGINGSSAVGGAFSAILYGALLTNTGLVDKLGYDVASQTGKMTTINQSFFQAYTDGTGWGQTGALIIATMIFSNVKSNREIAKLGAGPAVFNINEPITFGFPLVLNVIYFIPLMLLMPLHTVLAWLVVDQFGWVHKNFLLAPWTLPLGINALFTTGFDWKAPILTYSLFGISIVTYIPFVLLDNKFKKKQLEMEDPEILEKERTI